jgi:glycosyltransferase involved in cell wall biosynthesis
VNRKKESAIKKSISIVIPAYNEEGCIDELVSRLTRVFNLETNYFFECLIIDNGSTDNTWLKLKAATYGDARFRPIKLSRNFGMDGGLTAGIDLVEGDALVLMAADLQDPPELIPEFLRKWEEGYENIYGLIVSRKSSHPLRRMNSWLFYRIADYLSNGQIVKNASDFRLVDRKVYLAVRSMGERIRFVRGLFAWVGFKSIPIELSRPPRFAGESNAHTSIVLDLAIKGILSNSYKPLKLISTLGLGLSLLSFMLVPVFAVFWVIVGVPFSGFGTIVAINLVIFSLIIGALGILAEYLALNYEEAKGRPSYLVSIDSVNENQQNSSRDLRPGR